MQMTDDEIRRNYNEAKNQKAQIGILADLNDCSKAKIKQILGLDKKPEVEKEKPDVIQKLYEKLDFLDEEIKRYEKAKQDCEKLIAVFEEDYQTAEKIAKEVLDIMIETKKSAKDIVEEKGLKQNSNLDEISAVVDKIIQENSKQVEQYKAGNERLFGFFVGQVMKATGGKINPQIANQILKEQLSRRALSTMNDLKKALTSTPF